VGAPAQSTVVAAAEKVTARGAVPEEGDAEAVQESVQGGAWVAVTVPILVQVTPTTVAVMVHVNVPSDM
jgi:hypothetical protein